MIQLGSLPTDAEREALSNKGIVGSDNPLLFSYELRALRLNSDKTDDEILKDAYARLSDHESNRDWVEWVSSPWFKVFDGKGNIDEGMLLWCQKFGLLLDECLRNNTSFGYVYDERLFEDSKSPYYGFVPSESRDDRAVLLQKIGTLKTTDILYGKTMNLEDESHIRHYEFDLKRSPQICYLYVKDKKRFFKFRKGITKVGRYQRIPITYSVLSQLSDEELYIIIGDLD